MGQKLYSKIPGVFDTPTIHETLYLGFGIPLNGGIEFRQARGDQVSSAKDFYVGLNQCYIQDALGQLEKIVPRLSFSDARSVSQSLILIW